MTKVMLVASPGGHLDELMIMVDILGVDTREALWVTGRTAQTESVLADQHVVWVPRVGSGQIAKAALALPRALRLHRRARPDLVVSTGALLSVPHLLAASVLGCEAWFIDSATRVRGPSSTGRFARRLTHAHLFVQGQGWGDPAWSSVPGVFDAFEAIPGPRPTTADRPRTAVVSLGTELWPFDRAVLAAQRALVGLEVTWQTGTTSATDADGNPLPQWLPAADLHAAFDAADVVVTHAGVGSVLAALRQGKVPVILPRRAARQEMVDDHQVEFAAMIERLELAVVAEPQDLSVDHLVRAAKLTVKRRAADVTLRQMPLPRR